MKLNKTQCAAVTIACERMADRDPGPDVEFWRELAAAFDFGSERSGVTITLDGCACTEDDLCDFHARFEDGHCTICAAQMDATGCPNCMTTGGQAMTHDDTRDDGTDPGTLMGAPLTGVRIRLTGTDGNAFAILARVRRAMKAAKVPEDMIKAYMDEATAGDYDHLLAVTIKYVEVS